MSVVKLLAISFGIAVLTVGTASDGLARKAQDNSVPARNTASVGKESGTESGAVADEAEDKDLEQVTAVLASTDKLIAAGKLDEAIASLINALKDYGENPHLRERLSRIYYLKGAIKEAISELEVAISMDPTVFDYHAGVAWLYSIDGNYSESVKFAKQAIALDSTKAYPLVVMGFSLGCMGRRQQAAEFLKRAIELEPDNPTAHLYLADVLLADGDYKAALPLYQKSLKLDPKQGGAYVGLGDCFRKLGHQKEALAAYKRGVDLAPQDPTARGHLGFALSQSGDYMGAMRQGFAANSIRIGQYWGKFMGMFVAVWAGIFILFGTIFGAMFMGSRFHPLAGEKVLNEFMLVFYRDRPGRFVVTDRRVVFVPELVSRWFGATRVSIQREQIMSAKTEAASDVTILVINSTSETSHSFRVPAPIVEPLKNVLIEQGLFGENLQSLDVTGAVKAVSDQSEERKASSEELDPRQVTGDAQEQSNSFIAASFDFRTPEAAQETDSASTMKLEAVDEEEASKAVKAQQSGTQGGASLPSGTGAQTLGRPKPFAPQSPQAPSSQSNNESAKKKSQRPKQSPSQPQYNRRAEDKPAYGRRADDKKEPENS